MSISKVKIVGAGLIGTSIALALKSRGVRVKMTDQDPGRQKLATDLLGSTSDFEDYDLILIATPIESLASEVKKEFSSNPQATFMDIGGLKSKLVREVEELPELSSRFVSLHPMAGREISGPQAARADLFDGRALLITPTSHTSRETLALAREMAELLGSTPYEISAPDHDRLIAGISHMPQIVSSLLASTLVDFTEDQLALSGGGLRDVTRIASSDAALWSSLLNENRESVLVQLEALDQKIGELRAALQSANQEEITKLLHVGKVGREKIPGKHGAKNRNYTMLPVVIEDKPGQLARLFEECAQANVNVEDLTIEHSPAQETGLITLALSSSDAQILEAHLLNAGWRVHSPLK